MRTHLRYPNLATRTKKPTWLNTRRYSTTSVYSSTGSPDQPGRPLSSHPTTSFEANRFLPPPTHIFIGQIEESKSQLRRVALDTAASPSRIAKGNSKTSSMPRQPPEQAGNRPPSSAKDFRGLITDESPAPSVDQQFLSMASPSDARAAAGCRRSFLERPPGLRQRESWHATDSFFHFRQITFGIP